MVGGVMDSVQSIGAAAILMLTTVYFMCSQKEEDEAEKAASNFSSDGGGERLLSLRKETFSGQSLQERRWRDAPKPDAQEQAFVKNWYATRHATQNDAQLADYHNETADDYE